MTLRTKLHHTSSVFKKLYLKERNQKQKKRYQAIYLLSKNYDVKDVCDIVGITRRMLNFWISDYAKEGLSGLVIRKYKGAKPKIDAAVRNEIVEIMQTPPRKIGLNFSSWNTKTVQIWLKETHKLDITKPRIFQVLKEEGFSWKKGEHSYILSDEEEQKKFIRKARKIFRNLTSSQIALFEDECTVRQHPTLNYMWMKKGTVMEVPTYGNHKKKGFSGQ